MTNREVELAWVAGFFEGEGCVTSAKPVGKAKTTSIRIAVTQNGGDDARARLQRIVDAVGEGEVKGPYDYIGRYNNAPTKMLRWTWQVYGDRARRTLALLEPHMTQDSPKIARMRELEGTRALEAIANRRVRCKRGHPFSVENTRFRPNGRRTCRTCAREGQRVRRKGIVLC